MAAIPLRDINRAIVYRAPSWSKRQFVLKRESYPKGAVPEHLAKYLFTKGGVTTECAKQTEKLKGTDRINAMNSCVSAKLKKVI